MTIDQNITKALCHPERPMLAKGLCSSCYQKGKRNSFRDFAEILLQWDLHKTKRSDEALLERRKRINKVRRSPEWRFKTLKQRYGLSERDYQGMLLQQEGLCKICGDSPKTLYVDHCHTTNVVRGLLCPKCNTFVGYFETSPPERLEQIMKYLKNDRPS